LPASVIYAWSQVSRDLRPPWWVFVVATALGILVYGGIVRIGTATTDGYRSPLWLIGVVAVACSLGLWVFTRMVFDHRSLAQCLDPRTQSWALLWDTGLSVAIVLAAYAMRYHLAPNGWYSRWWWAPAAYSLGYAAGWVIRYTSDYPGYKAKDALSLIFDLAKVGHDELTWPALAGALIYFGVPVLLSKLWVAGWPTDLLPFSVAAIVVVWILLGNLHDSHLDIYTIQNAFNYKDWTPILHYD